MFQPLRVLIRHYYVKKWQLNTLNCHFCEKNLFLTTLSTTLLWSYYYMKINLTFLSSSKLYILLFIRMLIGHPYSYTERSVLNTMHSPMCIITPGCPEHKKTTYGIV